MTESPEKFAGKLVVSLRVFDNEELASLSWRKTGLTATSDSRIHSASLCCDCMSRILNVMK